MFRLALFRSTFSQPQGRLELSSEWAAAGVQFADIPSRSLKRDANFAVSNRVTPAGEAFHIPEGDHRATLDQTGGFSFSNDFTWLILVEKLSGKGTVWPSLFTVDDGSLNGRGGFGFEDATGRPYFYYRNAANSAWFDAVLGKDFAFNTPTLFVGTRKDGLLKFFADGELMSEIAAGNGISLKHVDFRYGARVVSDTIPAVNLYLAAVADQGFSDEQVASLSANPYQLFKSSTAIAASAVPTLTFPGVIDITATSARPQVTLTY